jgi:hypothetical protein
MSKSIRQRLEAIEFIGECLGGNIYGWDLPITNVGEVIITDADGYGELPTSGSANVLVCIYTSGTNMDNPTLRLVMRLEDFVKAMERGNAWGM